jgi:hypothetical protein
MKAEEIDKKFGWQKGYNSPQAKKYTWNLHEL